MTFEQLKQKIGKDGKVICPICDKEVYGAAWSNYTSTYSYKTAEKDEEPCPYCGNDLLFE